MAKNGTFYRFDMKCPRLGTKCQDAKCSDTKYLGTKCLYHTSHRNQYIYMQEYIIKTETSVGVFSQIRKKPLRYVLLSFPKRYNNKKTPVCLKYIFTQITESILSQSILEQYTYLFS